MEEIIKFLEDNQWSNFYYSLLKQYHKNGALSEKQIACVQSSIERKTGKVSTPITQKFSYVVGDRVEIKGSIANKLKYQLKMDTFFRNLKFEEVLDETYNAVKVKVSFISSVSRNCHACGRSLDTDISRATGIGPICAKRLNLVRGNVFDANEILIRFDELCKSFGIIGPVWLPKSQINIITQDVISEEMTDSVTNDGTEEVA